MTVQVDHTILQFAIECLVEILHDGCAFQFRSLEVSLNIIDKYGKALCSVAEIRGHRTSCWRAFQHQPCIAKMHLRAADHAIGIAVVVMLTESEDSRQPARSPPQHRDTRCAEARCLSAPNDSSTCVKIKPACGSRQVNRSLPDLCNLIGRLQRTLLIAPGASLRANQNEYRHAQQQTFQHVVISMRKMLHEPSAALCLLAQRRRRPLRQALPSCESRRTFPWPPASVPERGLRWRRHRLVSQRCSQTDITLQRDWVEKTGADFCNFRFKIELCDLRIFGFGGELASDRSLACSRRAKIDRWRGGKTARFCVRSKAKRGIA